MLNTAFRSLLAPGLLAAATVLAAPAFAQQALVPAQSQISFTAKQMGVPVSGQFKQFKANVAFDPAKPEAASIQFTVDTGSATMGVKESDAELPKSTWFNVPKFPQATFQSTSVKKLAKDKFEVAGKLTIKGVSSNVVAPVTLTQNGATTVAAGAFPIKRLTFRIGEEEWSDTSMVADEVQVKFSVALTGVAKL